VRSMPKYILAIQPNKCIPHININTTNCTKMMGKYKYLRVMNLRNFLRPYQTYKKLVSIFAQHQVL
jgi:hypothetical protein